MPERPNQPRGATGVASDAAIERDRRRLAAAADLPAAQRLGVYLGLSGPGWLQSAITLGGGSLAGSLYLGVLGGYSLLWLQPVAMLLGVVMLGVIGYVTLSTGQRPLAAINTHVSPVLGWGWAVAVAVANVIWCMPQHSIAYAVLSQNLLPAHWFGAESGIDKAVVAGVLLAVCTLVTWGYDRGGAGLRLYEAMLKAVVGVIVLCFVGVVVRLSFSAEPLDWGAIGAGLVPDARQFFRPAAAFVPLLDAVGPAGTPARDFWTGYIVGQQRDVIVAAAATAVGINMTFMYPYSMLRKGWTKEFRGLARFDLATGMLLPFILATGCVVIASATRFHAELPEGFRYESGRLVAEPDGPKLRAMQAILDVRNAALPAAGAERPQVSDAERRLAAVLIKRDALDLAAALEPLTGPRIANVVFGLGVLAMVLSTISALMLMSGAVIAEMLGQPPGGLTHKAGTLVAGLGGVLWPLFWAGGSRLYLAVVTSVFGFMLLPFAYVSFVALLNSKRLLGGEAPRGATRLAANAAAGLAAGLATVGAVYMIWVKAGWAGAAALGGFALLVILVAAGKRSRG
ncbi:MAG: divalent metal cation transporter [Planctomycetota bacterium]